MKVTVTARCSFCARKFDAIDLAVMKTHGSTRIIDGIVCEGINGKLCCDNCLCHDCGNGHATDAERDECEQIGLDDMAFDADTLRDWAFADRAGAV